MVHTIRLLGPNDATELTRLLRANRDFLAPWDPIREDSYFEEAGQLKFAADALVAYAAGRMVPLLILNPEGEIAGQLNLNGIVRGAFQSATLGYWVAENQNGRGLATAAVAEAVALAFGTLGLHRIEAGTLIHNVASQRVLAKNGFNRFGLAPTYLKIAGTWQDHILFQRTLPPASEPASAPSDESASGNPPV